MSDSDLSSEKDKKIEKQQSKRKNSPLLSKQSSVRVPPSPSKLSRSPVIQDETSLYDENRKLRRKLKELSFRLDQELQRAAQNKLKQQNSQKGNGHPVSLQSQNLQLQNAYKMIQRLQKTVRDYESKQAYQITLKRVMDLQGIIKKKDEEIDQLKTEVKTQKKMGKDKDKHVEELLENSKKMTNPAAELQAINKLKAKLKKTMEENDILRKKELEKHEKLVKAERRIVELEQESNQIPIGKEEGLLQEIEEGKKKYKEMMQRIERQNIYISKLNEKLTKQTQQKSRKSQRLSQKQAERRVISKSLQQLPGFQKKIQTSQLLEHLPSPMQSVKLRRY